MKKSQNLTKKREEKTIEVLSLVFAIVCLSLGFLAFSRQLKIESELTAHPDDLTFRVIFSTSNKKEETKPVEPKIEPRSSDATAENAIIDNRDPHGPVLTNLNVNFTEPGQRARYTFYVYNVGEYMAYLNSVYYSNVYGTNLKKVCFAKDGSSDESIKKACENIKVTIKTGDLTVSNSLYYINNRYLRPRTAKLVEVTVEYLHGAPTPSKEFEVIFGNIYLNYSLMPDNSHDI